MPKTNGSQLQVDKIHWIGGRPMFRKRPLHDKCEELLVILDSGMEWKDIIKTWNKTIQTSKRALKAGCPVLS